MCGHRSNKPLHRFTVETQLGGSNRTCPVYFLPTTLVCAVFFCLTKCEFRCRLPLSVCLLNAVSRTFSHSSCRSASVFMLQNTTQQCCILGIYLHSSSSGALPNGIGYAQISTPVVLNQFCRCYSSIHHHHSSQPASFLPIYLCLFNKFLVVTMFFTASLLII